MSAAWRYSRGRDCVFVMDRTGRLEMKPGGVLCAPVAYVLVRKKCLSVFRLSCLPPGEARRHVLDNALPGARSFGRF